MAKEKETEAKDEKRCPMLNEPCIRDDCRLWIKVTLSGTDAQGKQISHTPPEQCSLFWTGLMGLRSMQMGAARPPRNEPQTGDAN